uniref:Uncharacterized protein n=1 Tax=Lutzomyia longipalpis TaxID=7200 RepID=A0A1B0CHE9_LUTLO
MKIATETRLGFNEHYKVAQLPPRHSVSPNMFTKTLRGVLCLCALGTIFSAPPAVLAQSSLKLVNVICQCSLLLNLHGELDACVEGIENLQYPAYIVLVHCEEEIINVFSDEIYPQGTLSCGQDLLQSLLHHNICDNGTNGGAHGDPFQL